METLVKTMTEAMKEMMQLIHQLIDSHDDVTRYWNTTNVGIESYTYSDVPKVTKWIQYLTHYLQTGK